MKMKKHRIAAAFLLAVCLITLGSTGATAETNDEYFIGNTGMIRWQKYPSNVILPWKEEELQDPSRFHDWSGIYYAPGTGIQVGLTYEYVKGGEFLMVSVTDFASFEKFYYMASAGTSSDTYVESLDGGVQISKISDDEIQVDFTDIWAETQQHNFYVEGNSFVMTDVRTLLANAGEDKWRGSYEYWDEYSDTYNYVSVVPLYGSGDYQMVYQYEQYSTPLDNNSGFFMTEMDGMLVHAYPPGDIFPYVTYGVVKLEENNDLQAYDDAYAIEDLNNYDKLFPGWRYTKNGTGTMWKW